MAFLPWSVAFTYFMCMAKHSYELERAFSIQKGQIYCRTRQFATTWKSMRNLKLLDKCI